MIDNTISIKDINNKKLCICYYIENNDDILKLKVSLISQLNNTNIKEYSVILFTSLDMYNIVKESFKSIVGLINIIKVNPIFLNPLLLITHPVIQQYKVCIIYKPEITVSHKFDYTKLINYHLMYPLMFLSNDNAKDDFYTQLLYLNKNKIKNSLELTLNEVKEFIFSCYCSKVNKEIKLKELTNIKLIPDTKVLSLSVRLSKSPVLYEYIKDIIYSGIKASDIILRVYTDAKGYKIGSLSSIGLKLKTILN